MIIIDQYHNDDLPSDVEKLPTKGFTDEPEALSKSLSLSTSKSDLDLNRWDLETHFIRDEHQVKVGFLKRLFKGTTKVVKAGVVQEAKFYKIATTDEGRQVEIGVAVRLAVATSNYKVDAELSIPNLTAAAQLSFSDTRVGIYVVGSRISIGDILPAPADIGVENYSTYIDAFKVIQKRVFDPDNDQYYTPTILSYDES